MKTLPWVLVALLTIAVVVMWLQPAKEVQPEIRTETKIKTTVKVDTLFIPSPLISFRIKMKDTIRIGDTVVNREQAVYEDSLYRAWVSGYRPRLDSIEVYPRIVTNTVTNDIYHTITVKDKRRWGLGLQIGYGGTVNRSSPYIGIGISYNLLQW